MKIVRTKDGGWNVYVPTVNGACVRFHFKEWCQVCVFIEDATHATVIRQMGE